MSRQPSSSRDVGGAGVHHSQQQQDQQQASYHGASQQQQQQAYYMAMEQQRVQQHQQQLNMAAAVAAAVASGQSTSNNNNNNSSRDGNNSSNSGQHRHPGQHHQIHPSGLQIPSGSSSSNIVVTSRSSPHYNAAAAIQQQHHHLNSSSGQRSSSVGGNNNSGNSSNINNNLRTSSASTLQPLPPPPSSGAISMNHPSQWPPAMQAAAAGLNSIPTVPTGREPRESSQHISGDISKSSNNNINSNNLRVVHEHNLMAAAAAAAAQQQQAHHQQAYLAAMMAHQHGLTGVGPPGSGLHVSPSPIPMARLPTHPGSHLIGPSGSSPHLGHLNALTASRMSGGHVIGHGHDGRSSSIGVIGHPPSHAPPPPPGIAAVYGSVAPSQQQPSTSSASSSVHHPSSSVYHSSSSAAHGNLAQSILGQHHSSSSSSGPGSGSSNSVQQQQHLSHHHHQQQQLHQQQQQLIHQHHQQLLHQQQLHLLSATAGAGHGIHGHLGHGSSSSAPHDQVIQINTTKRPRLYQVQDNNNKLLHQPLTIDTRDANEVKKSTYTPQVEAISPTLPDEDCRQDLSPFKSTKDELLNNINRIDREISQTESQIAKLRRKQLELEAASKAAAACRTTDSSDGINANDSQRQQLSTAQLVYQENRSKASKSHSILDHLIPTPLRVNLGIPLYNQPSDTVVYHENMKKFKLIKSKLIEKLKEKSNEKTSRESYLTKTYDNLMKDWLKKLENKSLDNKSKTKDNKMREFFEKQFPELKKAREDKERLSRAGQRIGARSEADIEEIMDNIQEAELEDKKMRSYAVIPPIIHDSRQKKFLFVNTNGKIDDPLTEYKERSSLIKIAWTDEEKEIFREKYILYPKNFGLISTYLERKTVCDCVQYYYLSKKSENYRHLIRKHAKKRTRALVKAQAAAAAAATAANSVNGNNNGSSVGGRTSGRGKGNNNNNNNANNNTNVSNAANEPAPEDNAMDTGTNASVNVDDGRLNAASTSDGNVANSNDNQINDICCLCKSLIVNVAKSRIVNKSNCHLYGLRSDDPLFDNFENTPPNSNQAVNNKDGQQSAMDTDCNDIYHRICFDCRSKHVRKHCPVPSCKTADGKDKRLKSLPQQWFELPEATKTKYSKDLDNFPMDVKKACLRCVMRVSRRIGAVSPKTVMKVLSAKNHRRNSEIKQNDGQNKDGTPVTNNHLLWTEDEMKLFEVQFKENPKNWSIISSVIKSKNITDCKRFYYNFKYKLNLKKASPDGGNVSTSEDDSDEYWKGFTDDSEETSSADEAASDTASASSPPTGASSRPAVPPGKANVSTSVEVTRLGSDLRSLSQGSLKSNDGNDSSATLSADENDPSSSLRAISPAVSRGVAGQTITITPLSIAHATIDRHYRNLPPTSVVSSNSLPPPPPEGFMSRGRPSVISSSASSNDVIVIGSHRPTSSEGLLSRNQPAEGLMAPRTIGSSSNSTTEGLMSQRIPLAPTQPPQPPTQKFPSFLINPNAPTTGRVINSSSALMRSGQHMASNNLSPSLISNNLHNSGNMSVNNTGPGAKEEPTCVRDLIYQAIEMSLQTPPKPGSGTPAMTGSGNGTSAVVRGIQDGIPGINQHPHHTSSTQHGQQQSGQLPPGFSPQQQHHQHQQQQQQLYDHRDHHPHLGHPSLKHLDPIQQQQLLRLPNSSSAVIDMRNRSGHSPGGGQHSRQPPAEGLMMSHIQQQQQQQRGRSNENAMDEVQDLSKKSSSSSSRESPSARSITPVNLRKDGGHRPITPTIGTPVGRSPYQSSYPNLPSAMPPPAHSNRHETLTPDSYHQSRPSSKDMIVNRSPSVGPIGSGNSSSSSRHPSIERRTPTGSQLQQQVHGHHPGIPPPLVSSASMSPMKQSPKMMSTPMILQPGGMAPIPGGLMYGRPPPGMPYNDLLRPVSSKDNLPPNLGGMIPPPKNTSSSKSQLQDHKQTQQQMAYDHHQQLQHAEMYRRSITNSSPSPIRGPPGSTMMIHPPPGMAIGSADYRSFVEKIHREQQREREHQMMIDYNAAKAASMVPGGQHPPSAHGGQPRHPGLEPPGGSLSAQLLADFNTSKQMRREINVDSIDPSGINTRDGQRGSSSSVGPPDGRKSGTSQHSLPPGHRSPAVAGHHRESVSPQVSSRYTPYQVPTSRCSPSSMQFDHRLPIPPTGPNYLPSVHGSHHPADHNSPSSRSPHSPYSGSPSSSRYTPSLSPGGGPPRGGAGQMSPQQQQVRMGDRLVSVSVPTSVYSPYSITTSPGQQPQSLAHLPPHVQASMIQAERERLERSRYQEHSRAITPTSEHERLLAAARSGQVIQSGQWTPSGMIPKSGGGVIQSAGSKGSSNSIVPGSRGGQEGTQYLSSSSSSGYHPHKKYMTHRSSSAASPQHSPAMGHHPPAHGQPTGGNPSGMMFARTNDAFQTLVDAAAAQQSLAVPGQQQQQSRQSSHSNEIHDRARGPPPGHQQQQQQQGGGQMLYSALNFVNQKPPPMTKDTHSSSVPPSSSRGVQQQHHHNPIIVMESKNRSMDPNEVQRDKIRQLFNTGGDPSHPTPPSVDPVHRSLPPSSDRHQHHPLDVRNMTTSRGPPPHEQYGGKLPPPLPPQTLPSQQPLSLRKGSPPGPPQPQPPPSSSATVLVPRSTPIAATSSDEAARLFSRSFEKDSNSLATKAPTAQGFTAANLIDAIITHQINNVVSNVSPVTTSVPTIPFPGGLPPSTLTSNVGTSNVTVASSTSLTATSAVSNVRPPSNVERRSSLSPPKVAEEGEVVSSPSRKIVRRGSSIDSRDDDNSSPTELVIDDSDRPPSTKDSDNGKDIDTATTPSLPTSTSSSTDDRGKDAHQVSAILSGRKRISSPSPPPGCGGGGLVINDSGVSTTKDVSACSSEKKRKEEEGEAGDAKVQVASITSAPSSSLPTLSPSNDASTKNSDSKSITSQNVSEKKESSLACSDASSAVASTSSEKKVDESKASTSDEKTENKN